jgi:hypothetical protein
MRTATGLTVVAVGAILAFAVTSSLSFFNIQIAGWIIMLTGVAGIIFSRRDSGWLRRRIVMRRPRSSAVKSNRGPRALTTGQVLHRAPDSDTQLPEPRLPVAETSEEQTIPGTAEPSAAGQRRTEPDIYKIGL